jgi:hypothetical protein
MPAKGGRDLGQLRKVLCALAAVARAQRDRTAVVAQLRLAAVPRDSRDPSRNGAAGLEMRGPAMCCWARRAQASCSEGNRAWVPLHQLCQGTTGRRRRGRRSQPNLWCFQSRSRTTRSSCAGTRSKRRHRGWSCALRASGSRGERGARPGSLRSQHSSEQS